jgi:parallel beta-helix repeat protein
MKKCLAVGVILLFIGTCILPATAQNTMKSQSASKGKWLYVGGSGPGNYSVIQDAVDNASNGDTVYVYSGVYNRSKGIDYLVYLNKSVSLVGENKSTTILNGWWKSAVVEVIADNVEVRGFTIQNFKPSSGVGMEISRVVSSPPPKNVTIHDNIFVKNTLDGLDIIWCFNLTCYDNIFKENTENGCYVIATSDSSLTHNLFIKNGRGIYVGNSAWIEVSQNEFKENENGLYNSGIDEGNTLRCVRNNFINNTIQATFYINFDLLSIPGMIIYRAQWRHNYWSDWGHIAPRPIKGILFYENALFSYVLTMTIPWSEFDWFPVRKPYNITIGGVQ